MTRRSEGETDGGSALPGLVDADVAAVTAALRTSPQWCGMEPAAKAANLSGQVLLHAGPPIDGAPCAPILNSACLAAVLEGWADSADEAEGLVRSGAIRLAPAQDYGIVVPLAGVVSPSTQLHIVEDRHDPGRRAYSPINEGASQALRLGKRDIAILDHLRWLNDGCAEALAQALDEPLPLLPVADMALPRGDDCHGRTAVASARVAELLAPRLAAGREAARTLAFIRESAAFFLNPWMAASALMMRAADGMLGASLLRAAAGNGAEFGVQVAGLPGRWFTAPAEAPRGPIDDAGAGALGVGAIGVGAIGDSAVVDCFGLGGLALSFADEVRHRLKDYLPADAIERPRLLLAAPHPGLPQSGAWAALTARRVAATRRAPLVTLGIIERTGRLGRIGGGIYEPPLEPFVAAVTALDAESAAPFPSRQ